MEEEAVQRGDPGLALGTHRREGHDAGALEVGDYLLPGQAPLRGDDGGHVRVGAGQVRIEKRWSSAISSGVSRTKRVYGADL